MAPMVVAPDTERLESEQGLNGYGSRLAFHELAAGVGELVGPALDR